MKEYCTHCNKPIDSYSVSLSAFFLIEREVDGDWERVENSEVINSEKLCIDCFDEFLSNIKKFEKG